MRVLAFVLLIVLGPIATEAQVITFTTAQSCNYSRGIVNPSVYAFRSSRDARNAIDRIMEHTGLEPNFEIHAASIPNAAALIDTTGGARRRVILYNERFIDDMTASAGTEWAGVSILAHELGHHLNGHTLESGGSRPPSELAADRFSGFVLAKMGATLQQAQAALSRLSDGAGSSTHPPRQARLDAVYNGWRAASTSIAGADRAEPGTAPAPDPVDASPVVPQSGGVPSVAGTWENLMGRVVIQQSGNQVSLTEYMFGILPTARGAGTIVNGVISMQVQITSGEILNVQLRLTRDGLLDGFAVNAFGGRTALTYRRVE